MARKGKYDTQILKGLISKSESVNDFIAKAKGTYPTISEAYVKQMYYANRKQLIPSQMQNAASVTPDQMAQVTPVEVKEVTAKDVKIDTGAVHSESTELKDSYRKLLEEETGERVDADTATTTGPDSFDDATQEGGVDGNIGEKEGSQQHQFAVGKLLEQIIVTANNALLWPERPLTSMELKNVEEFSADAEASFSAVDLNDPNAVWYNLIIAGFLLPVVSRVDLLPKKIEGLMSWFKSMTSQKAPDIKYEPAYTGPTVPGDDPIVTPPPQKEKPKVVDERGGLTEDGIIAKYRSENVIAWLVNSVKTGYKVSPYYDPNEALDGVSYRDRHVIKNIGDSFD